MNFKIIILYGIVVHLAISNCFSLIYWIMIYWWKKRKLDDDSDNFAYNLVSSTNFVS